VRRNDDRAPLLRLATELATDAAALLVDQLARPRTLVGTKLTATDMVTDADRASEQLIVARLEAERPDDAIIAEEGTATGGTTGVRWIVDPPVGTTNYLYGFPGFAVSVAVEIDGRVEVGVVADPLHRDLFTAVLGEGAWRNGDPIRHSACDDLTRALVATGFSYDAARRGRQAAVLTHVLPAVRDIRRTGAAAVDLCSVGAGRVDAFYERGLQPWDMAAGALVAREAGCRTGDLDGEPASFEFCLAAPPALFEPLRRLLQEAGAASA
jgi:myo-inositol-1(or 4)-monophosphatase